MSKPKILITGAAGRLGRVLTHHLTERYDLILTDIVPPAQLYGHPFKQADISDLDAMRSICQGIDIILHLAGNPHPSASWESLLPSNIIGVYNIFQAAHEAGCRRVIFASSIHTILGYPKEKQAYTEISVRPLNLYGVSKVWGETVAQYYSKQKGLSCICLRLGWVTSASDESIRFDHPMIDALLTYDDLIKLIIASIEAPNDIDFGIFYGISNNRWKRCDISTARMVLDYEPEDDAFLLAKINARKRWYFFLKRGVRWFKRRLGQLGF